jgi:hypothetical protein
MKTRLSRMTASFIVAAAIFQGGATLCYAQLRLSIVGWNDCPLATFDETVDASVTLYLEGLRGMSVDGVEWHLGYRVAGHATSGFPGLADTRAWYLCGSYPGSGNYYVNVRLFTESGGEADWGAANPTSADAKTITGLEWRNLPPTAHTHMVIQYSSGGVYLPGDPVPGTGCTRWFLVPITWVTDEPVPSARSTWGHVKDEYEDNK